MRRKGAAFVREPGISGHGNIKEATMTTRNILVISGADSKQTAQLRQILTALRPRTDGMVSGYFNGDLQYVENNQDFSRTGYIVLGLSDHSMRKDSSQFVIEKRILDHAIKYRIPVAIIADTRGRITAPYLIGHAIDLVKLVVEREPNQGCSTTEMYPNAEVFTLAADDGLVSTVVVKIVEHFERGKSLSPISAPYVSNSGEFSGWNNRHLTD